MAVEYKLVEMPSSSNISATVSRRKSDMEGLFERVENDESSIGWRLITVFHTTSWETLVEYAVFRREA